MIMKSEIKAEVCVNINGSIANVWEALTNPELIDLYERVPVGTKVVVRQAATL